MTSTPADRIDASIVITTRNRREDTLVAVASCFAQTGVALEVLVYDDASDDGTAMAVRAAFPSARVHEAIERVGYIVHRNAGFRDARGRYVFSIDDDAYFSCSNIVADVVAQMEADHGIGAIAIPYIEPAARQAKSNQTDPFAAAAGDELRNFVGCSHAVRRELALRLGGYRDFFVHQGEEREFCLRLWAAGYRVVYGDCGLIVHMVSPRRETGRMTHFGIRNQIVGECLNAPLADLLVRVPTLVLNSIRYRFEWRTFARKVQAIGAGLKVGWAHSAQRRPVAADVYAKFRALSPHGPCVGASAVPLPVGAVPPSGCNAHATVGAA